jgi:hypothetical protein
MKTPKVTESRGQTDILLPPLVSPPIGPISICNNTNQRQDISRSSIRLSIGDQILICFLVMAWNHLTSSGPLQLFQPLGAHEP